ncbi:MAG: imidazole glycerol phosphate synthase, glutamine amidotransferase subunit [Phycisphaerales bacterium]|nr:imidazole glycerol phosphate synthase, glutamine amidotransferase subunit [Phycisphaerales bacterium]MDB5354644.1 imidazole glycerol phosphate synthase, glutamine amidotransferase subunit [Phycisphaerales bacterium]
MSMPIAIVDYGMANLRSVQKAFEQVGHRADIISRPEEIERADKIVLPGVGAFQDAVATLREKELAGPIVRHIERGKPFLGICLGLQMLFDVGYEDGEHRGLGVFRGKCVRFDVDETLGLKVPHMGWNQLEVQRPAPLFNGLPQSSGVYFVHGYHVVPQDQSLIATTTDYGRPFVSSIWRDNVFATQFHPEKSQKVGLQILSNFAGI